MHVDKHVTKMVLEYCQLLSTAHRVLDGVLIEGKSDNGRKVTRYELDGLNEELFYKATHINHPSAIWCRQSAVNYKWLYNLLVALCREYTFRYGRIHKVQSSGLMQVLYQIPNNIKQGTFTEPTPAMPDDVKVQGNSIASYRNYYRDYKQHLLSWKGKINSRPTPQWIFDPELNNA
jgi:hypothetical protein